MEGFQRIAEKVKHLMEAVSRRWGCVVTMAVFFIFMTIFGTLYSFGILLIELQEEFNSGASETCKSPSQRNSVETRKTDAR